MNYKRCMYFVEGECEEQLINALKLEPRRLIPGKVKVHNVIQDILPRMVVNKIQPGTNVIFVFDTDIPKTDVLQKNIKYVKKYTSQVKLVCLAEVMNFEDEIVRATDVNKAKELTRSPSNSEFKSDLQMFSVLMHIHANEPFALGKISTGLRDNIKEETFAVHRGRRPRTQRREKEGETNGNGIGENLIREINYYRFCITGLAFAGRLCIISS